jgi:uncharacterized protein with HEPN domain
MKDDKLYLLHMAECLEKIEKYTASGEAAFRADDMTRDAVIRNLQTLAESAGRISEQNREKHPEVEWRDIAAFRNVAVHDYLGIDWKVIWDIVAKDLPALKPKIQKMLE